MTDAKVAKNAEIFYCRSCDFKCSKKSNFQKHLSTDKHKNRQNTDARAIKMPLHLSVSVEKFINIDKAYLIIKKNV